MPVKRRARKTEDTQEEVVNEKIKAASKTKSPDGSESVLFTVLKLLAIAIPFLLVAFSFRNLPEWFSSDLVKINQYSSIREGFERTPREPFLVKNPPEFVNVTLKALRESIAANDFKVYGYDENSDRHDDMDLKGLVRDWDSDNLTMTIFDSPTQIVTLPLVMSDNHFMERVDKTELTVPMGQSIILSAANSYTSLHLDPLEYGGGWMYIFEGQKDWEFLQPKYADLLYDSELNLLKDLTPKEFVRVLSNLKITAKSRFRDAQAREGDFIYFPPGWMHRVKTYDKTIGVGGYIRPPACLDDIKESMNQFNLVQQFFEDTGIINYWNDH